MQVEVVYVDKADQKILELSVLPGATVLEVLQEVTLPSSFLEKNDLEKRIGIFGKRVSFDRILKEGDRIEIYQDLLRDPKEARRLRAKVQRRSSLEKR